MSAKFKNLSFLLLERVIKKTVPDFFMKIILLGKCHQLQESGSRFIEYYASVQSFNA